MGTKKSPFEFQNLPDGVVDITFLCGGKYYLITFKRRKMVTKILMKNMRFSWLFLCMVMSTFVFAQKITITGTVKDANGESIIGASVMEKGTSNGTITDLNGKFSISIVAKKTLVISYIGMRTTEIETNTKKHFDVVLEEDAKALDEVVVIGYGSVKRRDATGAISSISGKTLEDIPVASAVQALAGRLAGVNVTVSEGAPDAEISIRVRGGTSISQDNSPLYVVDGIIVSSISDIPTADIETFDILKDAASTAIYGSQAANGVVLITTKSGKAGKIAVNFNSFIGASWSRGFIDVLSPYEFANWQYELNPGKETAYEGRYGRWQDMEVYKSTRGRDWQKELFGNTGLQQSYNASLSGGSETTTFRVSLTRNDEDFIMLNSGYVRNNVDIKLDTKLRKNVKLGFNIRLSDETINGPSISSGSKLRNAVKYPSTLGIAGIDPSRTDEEIMADISSGQALLNPIQSIRNEYKKQNKFTNSYNLTFSWEILKGLTYNSILSYTYGKNKLENVWLSGTGEVKTKGDQPAARISDLKLSKYRITNTLSYRFKLPKKHRLDIVVGQEMNESKSDETMLYASWFPRSFTVEEVLGNMSSAGSTDPISTSIGEPTRIVSFFGRANYSFIDRYLFTFTMRADATSVFAPGKRWGTFPGASFAWRMSEEKFLKHVDWLSNLKLRLSYGSVGNARVGNYWRQDYTNTTSKLFYPNDEFSSIVVPATRLRNDNLTWETTYSTNVGLDFSFLKNRLSGTIDIYKNTTKNLLIDSSLPSPSGYKTQYQNVAQTSNRGLEFSLTGYIIDTKDFTLSANFNIAFNKNRVDKFSDGGKTYKLYGSKWNGSASPTEDYIVQEGQPLGQMYGFITDGMYSFDDFTFDADKKMWVLNDGVPNSNSLLAYGSYFGPGALKLKKIADDETNVINANDRTIIGNALPKHTGGFGFNATFKGLDAAIFFNWSYGNDVYNANKLDFASFNQSRTNQNLLALMNSSNRFTSIDPETGNNVFNGSNADLARLKEINADKTIWSPRNTQTVLHSWAIEDGSFLRLSNLTIGYTLPRKLVNRLGLEKLRFYATGYNLHCWTKYSGPDPEVDTRRSTPLTPGVDYSAYPKACSFVGGINLTF